MQNEEKKVKKSFFKGMKAELKKVIWPTGKQTVKSTAVTIAFVIIIAAALIVLDILFDLVSQGWYKLVLDTDENTATTTQVSGDLSGDVADDVTADSNDEDSVEDVEIPEEVPVETTTEEVTSENE